MKRQGSSTGGQPSVNKSDASTDLRSKIGAKLQTLLNGIDTDSILYAKRRKQLYEDLFGKPKYSEIIIDPTIVIKEEPEDEPSNSNTSTLHNSQNLISSAKSRLNELLNKQQDATNKYKDSGKENKNKSSNKSNLLQNPSCSKSPSRSLNKKRNSANKECTISSDIPYHEVRLKKLVVVLEDCMKSSYRTNLEPNCTQKQDGQLSSLNNLVNKKTAKLNSTVTSKSSENPETSISESSFTEDDSEVTSSKSVNVESVLSNVPNSPEIMEHVHSNTEEPMNHIPYYHEDESEMIDDPIIPQVIVDIKVGESISTDGNSNFTMENSDSEVELLCEKERITEVITLEDNEDEEVFERNEVSEHRKNENRNDVPDIAEVALFIHKCKQCGKSFRAESLLNFHIKMHGSNSFRSPLSLSHAFS